MRTKRINILENNLKQEYIRHYGKFAESGIMASIDGNRIYYFNGFSPRACTIDYIDDFSEKNLIISLLKRANLTGIEIQK